MDIYICYITYIHSREVLGGMSDVTPLLFSRSNLPTWLSSSLWTTSLTSRPFWPF